jgi:diacylglycerol kinase family enzyme
VREAEARGIDVHVLAPDDDLPALARAADAEALGMAGGDGSLAAVAGVAIDRDLPFVCIPFGTRNHFARDIGLDRDDPIAALDLFTSGTERRIDVGRAGDRLFLNNISFGVYARLVHRREAHRRRDATFARLRALTLTLRERHPEPFKVDGEQVHARVILVANNDYELNVLDLGSRERLDEGMLHAYLASGLLPRTWEERAAESFTLERAGGLRAAVDGEPVELDSPLEIRVEPLALRILAP